MSATPSPIAGSFVRLFLVSAVLLFAGAAQATAPVPIANKVVLDNGATVALNTPVAAYDSQLRIHIAALGSSPGSLDTCRSGGVHSCDVYYLLVDKTGQVLIKPSKINSSAAGGHGHPQIAVTTDRKAVITWGRGGGSSEKIRYAMVDPSKQGTLNGSTLNPAALVMPETQVGNSSGGKHALALDGKNIAYVIRNGGTCRSCNGQLRFIKFNPASGAILHAESSIGSTLAKGANVPAMALDFAGNMHIVYGAADIANDGAPAGYTMVDGNGNVLIGTTQLDDAVPGAHPHVQKQHLALMVDANGYVNIVYGDKRNTPDDGHYCNVCATGGTSIYTRLDPRKAPHNGNASNMATLRAAGPDVEIPGFWYGRAFMSADKFIHLIAAVGKTGSVAHVGFDPSNGQLVQQPVIHTGINVQGVDYGPKFVTGVLDKVVWAESPPGGATLQLMMAPIASFY